MNLLNSDVSTLNTDQWTLLSNLIQVYQESQLVAIAQRLTQTHLNCTDRSSMDMIHGKLIEEWGMSVYETTSRYLRLNDDLCQLPSDDRSIIVRTATANISCMGSTLITRNYPLYHIDIFTRTITNVYGEEVINKHRWSMKFMDSDMVLLKLALSLFAFSEINYSFSPNLSKGTTNVLNIVKVQNRYAEVTWKYLLYRYDYCQAVRRFVNLTSWFIATAHYIGEMQNLSLQADNINSLVEETELKLVSDDIDRVTEINE